MRRPARRTSSAIVRQVLEANARDLLAYFERRVREPEDAADLLGETFLTVWRRIDDLPADPERRRMWLFVTARNTLANFNRAGIHRGEINAELRERLRLVERDFTGESSDETRVVRDAVARLPAPLSELVSLIHWEGFSIVEAAEVMGTNPSTTRSRYAVARAQLREALSDEPVRGALPS